MEKYDIIPCVIFWGDETIPCPDYDDGLIYTCVKIQRPAHR